MTHRRKPLAAPIPLLFLALSLLPPALAAERRVALVIGNGSYAEVPLRNPSKDAKAMDLALRSVGFSVSLLVDADYAAMNRAIRDFGASIKGADTVALFYYSGHGVQYQGANYLVPVRADIQGPEDLPYTAVNAEQVYAKMAAAGAGTNIVILDACRNNPFPGAERALERGLAVVGAVQPPRSLIVYSTAPGKAAQDGEGENGVFTAALLRHLADPRVDAERMLRSVRDEVITASGGAQVPWNNSALTGDGFYFAGRGSVSLVTAPAGADVYVDGVVKGRSPLVLADIPRYAEVEIQARLGSKTATRRLKLGEAESAKLELELVAGRGGLAIVAGERLASVLVDGSPAPLKGGSLIEELEAGTHLLELEGESSAWRGDATVEAGVTRKLEVKLRPYGSLALLLPAGSSCRIEGPGLAEAATRTLYERLSVGEYRLSVGGADWEDYAETVTVVRGQRRDFAPRLRRSAAYLEAKYGAELESLALAERRSVVDQVDVDQVDELSRRLAAEARPELAAIAAQAESLRGRLVALKERQAAAPAAQAAGSLPERGPPKLFVEYQAEYDRYAAMLNAPAAIDQKAIDGAAALAIKAWAQPYEDFQALAARANALGPLLAQEMEIREFDELVARRDGVQLKLDKKLKARKAFSTASLALMGVGFTSFCVNMVILILEESFYTKYKNAATSAEAAALRKEFGDKFGPCEKYLRYFGFWAEAIPSTVGIPLYLFSRPSVKQKNLGLEIEELNRQIEGFGAKR